MIPDFKETLRSINPGMVHFDKLLTLQVNLGNICNQRCEHCHLDAGPFGSNSMDRAVMEKIIIFLQRHRGLTLDVTGGCPELNPYFKFFLESARGLVSRLMVRTNLTILSEQGMQWIPPFYRDHQIVVVASLPCYREENVNGQRGSGVFAKSITALTTLNRLGYGSSLELNLVYNPRSDFLPPSQQCLEGEYRSNLHQHYGIRFNNLFTMVNAPLGRFGKYLDSSGRTEQYYRLLVDNFNPGTAERIMCRTLINVDWQGVLYNCDFNQASGFPVRNKDGHRMTIDSIGDIMVGRHEIIMRDYCYCCTAGSGSSCTGVLVSRS